MKCKFFFITVGIFLPICIYGSVYECVTHQGRLFTDGPCPKNTVLQKKLELKSIQKISTYQPNKIHPKKLGSLKRSRQAKSVETRRQKKAKQQHTRAARCKILDQKIKNIEERFKIGYTLKQGERLKQELQHFKLQRFKYCEAP